MVVEDLGALQPVVPECEKDLAEKFYLLLSDLLRRRRGYAAQVLRTWPKYEAHLIRGDPTLFRRSGSIAGYSLMRLLYELRLIRALVR